MGALSFNLSENQQVRFLLSFIQVFLFLAAALFQPGLRADVIITEFMADNDSVLADEDGDFSDWIELYNSGTDSVDLEGWYLSDDPEALEAWRFPALVLEAGDFVLVFASGKDRAAVGGELHTSFRLDSSGEYLGLIQQDGVTVSHEHGPLYPPQRENYSYGMEMQGPAVSSDRLGFPERYREPMPESVSC